MKIISKSTTILILLLIFGQSVTLGQDGCTWLIEPDTKILDYFDLPHIPSMDCGNNVHIGIITTEFPVRESVLSLVDKQQLVIYPEQYSNWTINNSTTQTTEILRSIHTLAPQADLFLYRLTNVNDFLGAAKWMAGENINIIVNLVAHPVFATSDLSPINEFMDTALEQNILWLNSAGNFGNSYYESVFSDDSAKVDGWHVFPGRVSGLLPVTPVDRNSPVRVYLIWNEPDTDMDIFALGSSENLTEFMSDTTSVFFDQQPHALALTIPPPFGEYIFIGVFNANYFRQDTDSLNFRIFVSNGVIELPVTLTGNSIVAPNENPNTLTIGTAVLKGNLEASSSSPSLGKPEILTYGMYENNEVTTGLATAIIAGFAARKWGSNLGQSALEIKEYLVDSTNDKEFSLLIVQETKLNYAIIVPIVFLLLIILVMSIRTWRKKHVQSLFDQMRCSTIFENDQKGVWFVLEMPFNRRGYPKLARYLSSIQVEILFNPGFDEGPSFYSSLQEVSGSDSISISLPQGQFSTVRAINHSAIPVPVFIPVNRYSFGMYFSRMLENRGTSPAIVWHLFDLVWIENNPSNIEVSVSITNNKFRKDFSPNDLISEQNPKQVSICD